MIRIVEADGKVRTVEGRWTPDRLRKELGGYLTQAPYLGAQVFVDEDGEMRRLPYNDKVSTEIGMPILGKAIFLTGSSRIVWG